MKDILIIEDDLELNEMLVELMSLNNIHCDTALSYESAEEKILKTSYDYYMVDICLHDKNGLNLIPLIKQKSSAASKIIIASGNISQSNFDKTQVWKCCNKPYDIFSLIDEIKQDQSSAAA